MRKFVWTVLFFVGTSLHADDFTMATWVSRDSPYTLYYSVFDGSSWTDPAYIDDGTLQGKADVCNAYDSSSGKVVATWVNNGDKRPYYGVYQGGVWTTTGYISSNSDYNAYEDVTISFNAASGTFMATWGTDEAGYPYYSIYDGSSWTEPTRITADNDIAVWFLIFSCYNPATGDTVATWVNEDSYLLYYAVYHQGAWSTPTTIDEFIGYLNAFVSYNPSTGNIIGTFRNGNSDTGNPYYSIYDGSSWSTPALISPDDTYSVFDDIFTNYDPQGSQVVATWGNEDLDSIYSLYNETSWTTPAGITGSYGTENNVYVSYNATIGKIIATWSEETARYPIYAVFDGTDWTSSSRISEGQTVRNIVYTTLNQFAGGAIAPPSNLGGLQVKNDFGIVYEYNNLLSWTLSTFGSVAGYYVYADGVKVATLGPEATSYQEGNIQENKATTYSVTAFDGSNNESSAVSIVVR